MFDSELSVSEDIVESGLGMYSTLSENSTRGLDGGRVGESSGAKGSDFAVEVCGVWPGCSSGVLGRLLLRRGFGSAGVMR